MQNLNKENFFNEMQLRYPVAMKCFHDFIDQYKASVNWNEMFGDFGRPILNIKGEVQGFDNSKSGHIVEIGNCDYELIKFHSIPKFHDIPYEMQYGILLKFQQSVACGWADGDSYFMSIKEMKKEFESSLNQMELNIILNIPASKNYGKID